MCQDKIVITSIIRSHVLYWYHTYLFDTEMNRTEEIMNQHLLWNGIRKSAQKEVTNCDTCQRTNLPNKNMVNYQLSMLRKYHGIKYVYI